MNIKDKIIEQKINLELITIKRRSTEKGNRFSEKETGAAKPHRQRVLQPEGPHNIPEREVTVY